MNRRVLLVSNLDASFVSLDREILAEIGDVRHLIYRGRRQLPQLALQIARADLIMCWFVLGYATTSVLLGRALRKPVVLIPGGWDVRLIPEIGYGAMTTQSRIRKTRYALRRADLVLAISSDIAAAARSWEDRQVEVLHLGVDTRRFQPGGSRDGSILTVAGANNEIDSQRKGLSGFVKVAHLFPRRTFVHVGHLAPPVRQSLGKICPPNVLFAGRLNDCELLDRFQRASVYYQVSAHEGFGLAIAEAMACGCTPVVSDRGAIPEVVGQSGYYAEYSDLESIYEAVRMALDRPTGDAARKRIVDQFQIARRRERLLGYVEHLLSQS